MGVGFYWHSVSTKFNENPSFDLELRSALLWNFAQRRIVFSYRRLWTTLRSHLQGLSSPRKICRNVGNKLQFSAARRKPEITRGLHKAAKLLCGSLITCFARQVKRPSSANTPQHPATGLTNGSTRGHCEAINDSL